MSFEAMAWAANQTPKNSTQKLILLMLASHTNGHTGQCNPSHSILAEECCIGLTALKDNLSDLEANGYIKIIRSSKNGIKQSNQYNLVIHKVVKLVGRKTTYIGRNPARGRSENDLGVGRNPAIKQEVETGNETEGKFSRIPDDIRKRFNEIIATKRMA